MNSLLTVVFCALYFVAATEAYVICGTGELRDTECTSIKQCKPIIEQLKEVHSKSINERFLFGDHLNNLRCDRGSKNDENMKVCCPINKPKKQNLFECGAMVDNRGFFVDGLAEAYDYEWLALLEYSTPRGSKVVCSGVLISDRHVLTAASCLDKNYNITSVRLGEYDLATEDDYFSDEPLKRHVSIGIIDKRKPEDYSFFRDDFKTDLADIAILKLARSVSTRPICLPSSDGSASKFEAIGWGSSPYGRGPRFMKKSGVKMNGAECPKHRRENTICAKPREPKYACVVDVGAPLMRRDTSRPGYPYIVAGIHTPDITNHCKASVKTYTIVFKYIDWINQNMQ